MLQGVLQQRVAGAVARVGCIHHRGGETENAGRRAGRLGMRLQQMRRFVLEQLPRHDRWRLHVHAVGALLDREHRDLLLVECLRTPARDDAVLPAVPGTHHEFVPEPPLAQRTAAVVAAVGDGADGTAVIEDRDPVAVELHRVGDSREQLLPRAQTVPGIHGGLCGGGDSCNLSAECGRRAHFTRKGAARSTPRGAWPPRPRSAPPAPRAASS